ncbi:Protein of unknown function [Lactobacillus helveticus CIRM-BIA 103]|nr:Protein of unknown function [Lactobacillus helveticus CIRM-BIA 103]
MLFNDYVNRL